MSTRRLRWSLGVSLWQLVAGALPAWATSQAQVLQLAADGHDADGAAELPLLPLPLPLEFPEGFSPQLCDLLAGLLTHEPAARLTVAQAQAAPWFHGLCWESLELRTLAAPPLPP